MCNNTQAAVALLHGHSYNIQVGLIKATSLLKVLIYNVMTVYMQTCSASTYTFTHAVSSIYYTHTTISMLVQSSVIIIAP